MALRILDRARSVIPSSFLVRALAREGGVHHCVECAERMFVRPASGLCPRCFNARRPALDPLASRLVPDELACEAGEE